MNLSHFSFSLLLAIGDKHPNPPGFAFPRGVTGWVPWEADSEISTKCAGGLLVSALGIDSWERKEKGRKKKGGKRKGQDGKSEQEGKRKEQDWAKEAQLRLSLSKGCGHPPGSSPKAGMTFQSCLKLGVGNHSFIFPTDQSLNSSHSRRRHNSGLSGFFCQGPQLLAEGSSSTPGSQGNETFISEEGSRRHTSTFISERPALIWGFT